MRKLFVVLVNFLIINYCFAADVKSLIPTAGKIVSDGLKNSDSRIKANAIEVASSTGQVQFAPKIAELLKDPVVLVRFASALAIGDLQYKADEKKLRKFLNDPDLNVRIAAAYALCKFGDKQYLSVIQAATNQNDSSIKKNAATLLGKLKSTESLPILYKLKDAPNSDKDVSIYAAEAIARIGDEKISSKIWAMLISAYADDRYMGTCAMGALGGTTGANALLTMLEDDVPEVRLSAAEQLGSLGDPSGTMVVLEYLTNTDQKDEKGVIDKRNAIAALAIGQIGDEKLVEYLPNLLKSDSPFVRLAASKSVFILAAKSSNLP